MYGKIRLAILDTRKDYQFTGNLILINENLLRVRGPKKEDGWTNDPDLEWVVDDLRLEMISNTNFFCFRGVGYSGKTKKFSVLDISIYVLEEPKNV